VEILCQSKLIHTRTEENGLSIWYFVSGAKKYCSCLLPYEGCEASDQARERRWRRGRSSPPAGRAFGPPEASIRRELWRWRGRLRGFFAFLRGEHEGPGGRASAAPGNGGRNSTLVGVAAFVTHHANV